MITLLYHIDIVSFCLLFIFNLFFIFFILRSNHIDILYILYIQIFKLIIVQHFILNCLSFFVFDLLKILIWYLFHNKLLFIFYLYLSFLIIWYLFYTLVFETVNLVAGVSSGYHIVRFILLYLLLNCTIVLSIYTTAMFA